MELPHFADLPIANLQKVATDMLLKKVPYRNYIAREGEPAEFLFLVKSGQLKVEEQEKEIKEEQATIGIDAGCFSLKQKKERPKMRELVVLGPGNSFEDRSIVKLQGRGSRTKAVYPHSVIANSEDVVVWELPQKSLENLKRELKKHHGKHQVKHLNTSEVYIAQKTVDDENEERAGKAKKFLGSIMGEDDFVPEVPDESSDLGWASNARSYRGLDTVMVNDIEAPEPPKPEPVNLSLPFNNTKLKETSGRNVVARPHLTRALPPPDWKELCTDPNTIPAAYMAGGGTLQASYSHKGRGHAAYRASKMKEIMKTLSPDLGYPGRAARVGSSSIGGAADLKHRDKSASTMQSRRKLITEYYVGTYPQEKHTIVRMDRGGALSMAQRTKMVTNLQADLDKIQTRKSTRFLPDICTRPNSPNGPDRTQVQHDVFRAMGGIMPSPGKKKPRARFGAATSFI